MTAPTTGPCSPWITAAEVYECCGQLDVEKNVDQAVIYATNILYRLSGRQFPGLCERTVRPCYGDNCGCQDGPSWVDDVWNPRLWKLPSLPLRMNGEWYNLSGCCGGKCKLACVSLPNPITSVSQVVIDGVALDPSSYMVDRYKQICRLDGFVWPCSQDYSKDSTTSSSDALGTWEITYTYGREPGEDGKLAAKRFACEIARSLCGAECQLPARVKTLQREGVDMAFIDPMDFVTQGRVGIYEVDLWLQTVNPGQVTRRAAVRRIDRPVNNRRAT